MERAGPIIITALFGPGDDGWMQELRRTHFPPERNQVPAHLTLFHHLPPDLEAEIGRRLAIATAIKAPEARVVGVQDLGGGTALRLASEGLSDIRAMLADAFHGLLIPQDMAPWRPHITVQNKVARRDAIALQKLLTGRFEGRALAITGLASWRYLGGPWEPIRRHAFRG